MSNALQKPRLADQLSAERAAIRCSSPSPTDGRRSRPHLRRHLHLLRRAVGRSDPNIANRYYRKFQQTKDPKVLLEFMDKHPVQFEFSNWVLAAFGYLLLGFPFESAYVRKKQADKLFRGYWHRVTKGPDARDAWRVVANVMIRHTGAEKFLEPRSRHRTHFQQVAWWIADRWIPNHKGTNDDSFAAFQNAHKKMCSCINAENFPDIRAAVEHSINPKRPKRPATSTVLQEYVGVLCEMSGRNLRRRIGSLSETIRRSSLR